MSGECRLMKFLFVVFVWLLVGMSVVFLGGITEESTLWWLLFAIPSALLVLLVAGMPVLVVIMIVLVLFLETLDEWRRSCR